MIVITQQMTHSVNYSLTIDRGDQWIEARTAMIRRYYSDLVQLIYGMGRERFSEEKLAAHCCRHCRIRRCRTFRPIQQLLWLKNTCRGGYNDVTNCALEVWAAIENEDVPWNRILQYEGPLLPCVVNEIIPIRAEIDIEEKILNQSGISANPNEVQPALNGDKNGPTTNAGLCVGVAMVSISFVVQSPHLLMQSDECFGFVHGKTVNA
ncbi:hypothetical protein ACHAXH_008897 [Discostella pseudostelligera]